MARLVRRLQGEGGGREGAKIICSERLWAITAVLKVARRTGGPHASPADSAWDGGGGGVSGLLRAAAVHVSDDLRLNALEMVCLHPKATEAPSSEELEVVREFLSLNMKSSSRCFIFVWFGLVWFGLVWFGLVWFGLVGFSFQFCFVLFLFVCGEGL